MLLLLISFFSFSGGLASHGAYTPTRSATDNFFEEDSVDVPTKHSQQRSQLETPRRSLHYVLFEGTIPTLCIH
jgi:hypothetical protein